MKIKKIFTLILAILMLLSSIPITFAEEVKPEENNYNLHKDLVFDYIPPVGDKAKKEFKTMLTNFSVETSHTYKDNEGVKYTFSFPKGSMKLESIMVPDNASYTLPATVTLYYFVASAESPEMGIAISDVEKIPIKWEMPIGVVLCKREVEINVIDTKLLGNIDVPRMVLSNNITSIANSSFNTDIGMHLKEIYAPSVEIVGKNAFLCCANLSTVYMPKLRRVDENAFAECTALKNFTFEKLSYIGKEAFSDCSSLKKISLPKSVTYLLDGAFSGCTALENIMLPANIQINALPKDCFKSCTSLKEVTLPYEIIIISESAFSGCANLKVINFINTNVSTIAKNAFFGCLRLETAYLPLSLVNVQPNSFESCPNLRFVYFASSLTDSQKTSFNKAGFGEKIVTEKDTEAPIINIKNGETLEEAPDEIVALPTTLVVTDTLDVENVTVTLGSKSIKTTSRIAKTNSYSTKVWDIPLEEDGEYIITAVDAIGNKTERKIKYTNSEIIITEEDIEVKTDEFYDELPVLPPVKITKNNKVLVQDEHYTVEYKNADSVGTAQIIIKGIAPYKGEITINYEIKEKPFVLGDANKDGQITASDARLVLRMSAMLETYDNEMIKIVDVTGDGVISASDARLILRKSAMLE